ncbi:hypothetical protein HMPREF0454_01103 [Hafnia alvei ATCC 51873]|uniref:Uncharacterized protein n=1 Tax=Hafnia alvei ATCC 51873 TaxID=1002364 RepID=G9Y3L6_HAFAL|nr:hypothetical protein HMPREF0454_01103 [Hafnia alvei ATCC 51873]
MANAGHLSAILGEVHRWGRSSFSCRSAPRCASPVYLDLLNDQHQSRMALSLFISIV